MAKLANVTGWFWRGTSHIASVCLLANVLMIIANILMRRFFGAPIWGSTEFVKYISLITASFALAQNEWFDGNIKMTLLPENLPEKARQVLMVFVNIFCAAAFALISRLLVVQAIAKFTKWDISPELQLPIFIFASVLAAGFILLTVSIALKAVLSVYTLKTGIVFNLRNIRTIEQE